MSKSCGSCQNFLKFKNDQLSGGLCLSYDARTDTDRGHKCPLWKAIPFHSRKKYEVNYDNQRTVNSENQVEK